MRNEAIQDRQESNPARRGFWLLWSAVLVLKLSVAARLPLFVDEAFYWQEGRHLAAAYSDLPGLTAWLTRLGVSLGGEHVFALRAPFLFLAALVPLLVVRITSPIGSSKSAICSRPTEISSIRLSFSRRRSISATDSLSD